MPLSKYLIKDKSEKKLFDGVFFYGTKSSIKISLLKATNAGTSGSFEEVRDFFVWGEDEETHQKQIIVFDLDTIGLIMENDAPINDNKAFLVKFSKQINDRIVAIKVNESEYNSAMTHVKNLEYLKIQPFLRTTVGIIAPENGYIENFFIKKFWKDNHFNIVKELNSYVSEVENIIKSDIPEISFAEFHVACARKFKKNDSKWEVPQSCTPLPEIFEFWGNYNLYGHYSARIFENKILIITCSVSYLDKTDKHYFISSATENLELDRSGNIKN